MTNHAHGIQARNSHKHSHFHNHARFFQRNNSKQPNVARSPNANLDNRQADTTVQIVQTVSVVEIIDSTGGILGFSTIPPQIDTASTAVLASSTAVAASGASTSLSEASGYGAASTSITAGSASLSSTSSFTSAALSSQETTTDVLPASSSLIPSLTGIYNSTTTGRVQSFNSTTVSLLNSTSPTSSTPSAASSLISNSSTLDLSSTLTASSSFSSDAFSTISSDGASSWLSSGADQTPTATATGAQSGVANGGTGGGNAGGATATSSSSSAATSTKAAAAGLTSAQQSAVIGGVVGGVAGIALIVLALLFVLKWKRGNGIKLLGDGDGPAALARGLPSSGVGPGGSGAGDVRRTSTAGGSQNRPTPFAIPSTLAALGGFKRTSQPYPTSPETSERGFYRVSGKKLTSVLQSGGDGYSEPANPHQSMFSDMSYRDSQGFFGGTGTIPLQLGSPMRPDSGVPVIRTGPARTPVEEYGPFSPFTDEPRQGTPTPPPVPRPGLDPLGRTLVSHDGSAVSRGSGANSRFAENIS